MKLLLFSYSELLYLYVATFQQYLHMQHISQLLLSHCFECFTVVTMTWFTVTEYPCHKWPRICSACNHYRICNKSNKTDITSGAGAAYPSGSPEFTPFLSGVRVARSLVFWVMFYWFLFLLLFFFFWPLYCDLRLLITLLVSSNFFCNKWKNL